MTPEIPTFVMSTSLIWLCYMNHMKDFLCQQQDMKYISIPSLEQREAGTEVLWNISRHLSDRRLQ